MNGRRDAQGRSQSISQAGTTEPFSTTDSAEDSPASQVHSKGPLKMIRQKASFDEPQSVEQVQPEPVTATQLNGEILENMITNFQNLLLY